MIIGAGRRARAHRPAGLPTVRAVGDGTALRPKEGLDVELSDLPPELRWREWMGRVEEVIFASAEPVTREILAGLVGRDCSIDLLIDDIREELRDRPYEFVSVARPARW